MAIVRYSDTFWYPDGALATNVEAKVFHLYSPTVATLWADQAGTIPLPNPTTTDGSGVLTFYAEQGDYWLHINKLAFRIVVSGAFTTDTTMLTAAAMSTGLMSGGDMDIAPSGQAVEISKTSGYVIDVDSEPGIPAITKVEIPAQTVPLTVDSQNRRITWWLVSAAGTIIQQEPRPTPQQRRTHIVLGFTTYDTVAEVLSIDQSLPTILTQQGNQFADLLDALAPFSISGNVVTPSGANLSLNKSAGFVFSRAFSYSPPPGDNPHESFSIAQNPAVMRRITRVPAAAIPPTVTTLNPTQYDNNGVLTNVGGGANSSTLQRVWLLPENDPTKQIFVQYGQTVYGNLNDAINRVGAGTFVTNPIIDRQAALIAYIAIIRTATNLTDPTQAVIITPGKLATP